MTNADKVAREKAHEIILSLKFPIVGPIDADLWERQFATALLAFGKAEYERGIKDGVVMLEARRNLPK